MGEGCKRARSTGGGVQTSQPWRSTLTTTASLTLPCLTRTAASPARGAAQPLGTLSSARRRISAFTAAAAIAAAASSSATAFASPHCDPALSWRAAAAALATAGASL
eukprot:6603167-Pyramimonas_sp.AAC.2